MRTTVDIPDALYRKLKSVAAQRGCTLRELIVRGIEGQLSRGRKRKLGRIRLPIIESNKPGWLNLTNRAIDKILLP